MTIEQNIPLTNDLASFVFLADQETYDIRPDDVVARIPAGLTSRLDLCRELQQQLRLPSYFRQSWSVLIDILPRLVEGEGRRVLLIHEDVPRLERDLETGYDHLRGYMETLRECTLRPRKYGYPKELIVVFPQTAYYPFISLFRSISPWELYWQRSEGLQGISYHPNWSQIQSLLSQLDGVACADEVVLERNGWYSLKVTLHVEKDGYTLTYTSRSRNKEGSDQDIQVDAKAQAFIPTIEGCQEAVHFFWEMEYLPPFLDWQKQC